LDRVQKAIAMSYLGHNGPTVSTENSTRQSRPTDDIIEADSHAAQFLTDLSAFAIRPLCRAARPIPLFASLDDSRKRSSSRIMVRWSHERGLP